MDDRAEKAESRLIDDLADLVKRRHCIPKAGAVANSAAGKLTRKEQSPQSAVVRPRGSWEIDTAQYRHNAAQCLAMAEGASDQASRNVLVRMAQRWHALAVKAELDADHADASKENEIGATAPSTERRPREKG